MHIGGSGRPFVSPKKAKKTEKQAENGKGGSYLRDRVWGRTEFDGLDGIFDLEKSSLRRKGVDASIVFVAAQK